MPLAGLGLAVFVLAEDVLVEMHVRMTVLAEEVRGALGRGQHVVVDVIDVDVDADGADHPEVPAQDGDGRALEAPRADPELVVELVLVLIHAPHQIDEQRRRAHLERAPGDLAALDRGDRAGRIGEIVHQHLDPHVRKGAAEEPGDVAVVLEELAGVVAHGLAVAPGEQPLVGAQILGRELRAHVVLLADEDQLARGAQVAIAEQVVNAVAEVLETELGEVLGGRDVGIEVILMQRLALQAPPLAETADVEAGNEEQCRSGELRQHRAEPFAVKHAAPRPCFLGDDRPWRSPPASIQ